MSSIHPFQQSSWRVLLGLTVVVTAAFTHWALLTLYTDVLPLVAVADSVVYIGILAVAGYFYWYITGYVQAMQTKVVVTLLAQFIALVNVVVLLDFFELEPLSTLLSAIPLRVACGVLWWVILLQWYNSLDVKQTIEANKVNRQQGRGEPVVAETPTVNDVLDRISVKDNSRIHIIKVDELLYVQAYGDYVMLFTDAGKHVKELTMKYLETNLPTSFIRIHRSYIVNTDYIVRVELFGKETYQVRLKNGTYLRVSTGGYKLLKDRLLL